MKIELHIVAHNEERILPYALRHASTFSSKIVVHDGESTDKTRSIAESFGATVIPWNTGGQINDQLLTELKNTAWLGTDADWVGFVDADEFIYFPMGLFPTLDAYTANLVPIVKTHGFEMLSDVYPTTKGQIYDEIKMGGRDDKWYGKPCLWSPKLVKTTAFAAGAHEVSITLQDGRRLNTPTVHSNPPTYLLHFHHIMPVEEVAAKYDAHRARMSEVNRHHRWGNFQDGSLHAKNKRALINSTLQRIIP